MSSDPTPKWLVVQVAREQGGIPLSKTICPWCGQPGATDPHHAFYKRSSGVASAPDEVLHTPQNVVILHHSCHDLYGQTKAMTAKLLAHKVSLGYDIFEWVEDLIKKGVVKHRPDIYG